VIKRITIKKNKKNLPKIFKSKKDIQEVGHSLVGKKIKEFIDLNQKIVGEHKGAIGQLIEHQVFGQAPHNDSEPDLTTEDGQKIELKVAPVKRLNGGEFVPKERIVLNDINFLSENTLVFEESSFWKKNKNLYVLFYEYIKSVSKKEYRIHADLMVELSREDLIQIKKDWSIISEKIRSGNAHNISESDTLYLGACTKAANSKIRTIQKNGIKAKPRAYSYKTKFIKYLLRNSKKKDFSIIENYSISLEDLVREKTKPYIGKTKSYIIKELSINPDKSKNSNEHLLAAMLGLKGKKLSNSAEFKKADLSFKTVVFDNKNNLRQSMSIINVNFIDIVNEEWETSEIREYFLNTKFVFAIFKGEKENPLFLGVYFWNLSEILLDKYVKEVWFKTKKILLTGNLFKNSTNNTNNFPKISDELICHVRPRAASSMDCAPLPFPDNVKKSTSFTKQCFWINARFIRDVIINSGLNLNIKF
jgi:DNA mismatch repair protein MutH